MFRDDDDGALHHGMYVHSYKTFCVKEKKATKQLRTITYDSYTLKKKFQGTNVLMHAVHCEKHFRLSTCQANMKI